MSMKLTFLGLPDRPDAQVALIPAPLELTTSWKKGTKEAPLEILKVSSNMEFFDEEVFLDPYEKLGFFTYPIPELSFEMENALKEISELVEDAIRLNRFPIVIGGEHTVSLAVIKALKKFYPELKVLHMDAHLDLRDKYNNTKINHATVMRRIHEMGIPVLSVGIRTLCKEEYDYIQTKGCSVVWAKDLKERESKSFELIREFVSKGHVYLSFDMDVMDPCFAPGVGTPEPGGLTWFEVLKVLKLVVNYNLIGMDLVEVKPDLVNPVTEYIASKIIFKITAYLAQRYEGA